MPGHAETALAGRCLTCGAEVSHLWRPLLRDVLKGVRTVYGEAHEDDVSVRIGERPQTIVVLLT